MAAAVFFEIAAECFLISSSFFRTSCVSAVKVNFAD